MNHEPGFPELPTAVPPGASEIQNGISLLQSSGTEDLDVPSEIFLRTSEICCQECGQSVIGWAVCSKPLRIRLLIEIGQILPVIFGHPKPKEARGAFPQ